MTELEFQVTQILKHNRDGSFATREKRRTVLLRAARLLWEKFPGLKLHNLQQKHLLYLIDCWKEHKSIKTELSHIRWLLEKIDKQHLLPKDNDSLGIKRRIIVSNENKSWLNKTDIAAKIDEVTKIDETVGLVLGLCYYFGLRIKEASLFRPHEHIQEDHINIIFGTKGSRPRKVKIRDDEQANFLRILKEKIGPGRSLVPQNRKFIEFKNRLYYILRQCGIKRKTGLTAHGLRHTYSCNLFEDLTGTKAPLLRDGSNNNINVDKKAERRARSIIAHELGHGRTSVTSAYVGSTGR